eukprot:671398-Prymnesium_polylepis.1
MGRNRTRKQEEQSGLAKCTCACCVCIRTVGSVAFCFAIAAHTAWSPAATLAERLVALGIQ